MIFRREKLHQKKYVETTWIFQPSKLHRKKCVETTCIFQPSKLHWKEYVEKTWIFRPLKLRRKKYMETTWIFRSEKLHRKSTWKWSGNSSKFGVRRIDVICSWNWRRFNVECFLGCHDLRYTYCNPCNFVARSISTKKALKSCRYCAFVLITITVF